MGKKPMSPDEQAAAIERIRQEIIKRVQRESASGASTARGEQLASCEGR